MTPLTEVKLWEETSGAWGWDSRVLVLGELNWKQLLRKGMRSLRRND